MKNSITIILFSLLFLCSCEEYLDKSIEVNVSIEDVFQDFEGSQGFVEEMYAFVVHYPNTLDKFAGYGDDVYGSWGWLFDFDIDNGNLRNWKNESYFWHQSGAATYNTYGVDPRQRPGIWEGWDAIRKANIAIEAIEKDQKNLMVNATEEERNLVLGQAYFFRAYLHNEIMQYWGRVPYIDEVIGNDFQKVRPATYKECAMKANEDYNKAIQLLPIDWDDTEIGKKTLGDNGLRICKGTALAFKGKNLLIAASPLMNSETERKGTYDYDKALCDSAANAFGQLIKSCVVESPRYSLAEWDNYESVFYSDNWYDNSTYPGLGTELILAPMSGWMIFLATSMQLPGKLNAGNRTEMMSPTHNYIQKYFGMANGLSIEDDATLGNGLYDAAKPFEHRDPRFYKWLIITGDTLVENLSKVPEKDQLAQFYDGGAHRFSSSNQKGTQTGYVVKKFYPRKGNQYDAGYPTNNFSAIRLNMRLTDVYLMYAEALAGKMDGTGSATSTTYPSLTAKGAINTLRQRTKLPDGSPLSNINESVINTSEKFMDEVRRERAVELCWEQHRWVDIRRWNLSDLAEYKEKKGLQFDVNTAGEPINFREEVLLERICNYPKHFWLPFPTEMTQMYTGFDQNPGW